MSVKIVDLNAIKPVPVGFGHSSDQEDVALQANCPSAWVIAGTLITLTLGIM